MLQRGTKLYRKWHSRFVEKPKLLMMLRECHTWQINRDPELLLSDDNPYLEDPQLRCLEENDDQGGDESLDKDALIYDEEEEEKD